jgi:hypothetical protein
VHPRVRSGLEALALLGVLGLVASVAYLPHADSFTNDPGEGPAGWLLAKTYGRWVVRGTTDDYEHTVHVDENIHWAMMGAIQRAGTLRHPDELGGGATRDVILSLRGLVHERGFHVALVSLQSLTGIAWQDLFRWLPALWAATTAWAVWAALRPWPGAWLAAPLVALVPTSARFLGPGFLVPIGFGLAWVAVALLLAPVAAARGRTTALLLLVVGWAFFIHLIAGFAAALVLACALPFARGERRGLAVLSAAGLAPVVWLFQAFQHDFDRELSKLGTLPNDLTIFDQLGLPILALWGVGCALAALRPPKVARLAVQAATLASVVAFAFIALNLALDLRLYALYDRWHQLFALLAAIPVAHAALTFGEALATLGATVGAGRLRVPQAQGLAVVLGVVLLAGAADAGLAGHLREPYYHVLDDADWEAFTWAAANVNGTHEVFLAHPWKATIFAAMTGKQPHTYLLPGAPPERGEDYAEFLVARRGDAAWLAERDISLVLDPAAGESEDLSSPRPGVALLAWPHAQELHDLRNSRR